MEKERQQEENVPQLTADLEGNYLLDENSQDLKAIGLFYAPTGGNVHKIAKRIKNRIKDHPVEMFHITDITAEKFLDYQNIILVSSTLGKDAWDKDETDEWSAFLPQLQKISLNGRQIALVGLGNHITYPNNFVDGMATLADFMEERGGVLIGRTETDGYTFNMSRALKDGLFVGLPLDEDCEPQKTEVRIEKWLSLVLPEM